MNWLLTNDSCLFMFSQFCAFIMSIQFGIPHTLLYSFWASIMHKCKAEKDKARKYRIKRRTTISWRFVLHSVVMRGNSEKGAVISLYCFLKLPNSVISYTISLSLRLLDFTTTTGSMIFNWFFFIICQLEYCCTPLPHLCLHVKVILENPEKFEFRSSQPKKRTLKCYQ